MTPTSKRPLAKVRNGGIAVFLGALILALIKHYVWTDLPADVEGPLSALLNAVLTGAVLAATSIAAGWITSLQPGEITATDQAIIAQVADRKAIDQAAEPKTSV